MEGDCGTRSSRARQVDVAAGVSFPSSWHEGVFACCPASVACPSWQLVVLRTHANPCFVAVSVCRSLPCALPCSPPTARESKALLLTPGTPFVSSLCVPLQNSRSKQRVPSAPHWAIQQTRCLLSTGCVSSRTGRTRTNRSNASVMMTPFNLPNTPCR